MKRKILFAALIVIIAFLIVFNVVTVRKVSRMPPPEEPPQLNESPARIYGVVEPAGREISLSPTEPGAVKEMLVEEGDTVEAGQLLCVLDNSVQQASVEAARTRVDLGETAAELSRDRYIRNAALLRDGSISESQYTELRLEKELDRKRLDLNKRELDLALARLENLNVRAPVDGIVYLCDIREGEYFGSEGGEDIIIGPAELQVRCDIEVIWIDRLDRKEKYQVLNAETGEPVGTALFSRYSRFLRSARVSTEDPRKRSSARYQEVIMDFTPLRDDIPIRMPVMLELPGTAESSSITE